MTKKVLIVADWLTDHGGAEVVVQELCKMFPEADICASVCEMQGGFLANRSILTTWVQYLPKWLRKRQQLCALLRPYAFRSIDVRPYDLIISSASAEAKAVGMKWRSDPQLRSRQKHVCYCHTPIRYYWSHYGEYLASPGFGWLNPLVRGVLRLCIGWLRRLDRESVANVDTFCANSRTTQERIQTYYGRDATIVYPGVPSEESIQQISALKPREKDYYVAVGRIVPYKRFDLIIDACNSTGEDLVIISSSQGPLVNELRQKSGPTIQWCSGCSHEEKRALLRGAQALIFPQEEDFGIVPIEAHQQGLPVIAYEKGGALETVISAVNGVFFPEQTVASLIKALREHRAMSWDKQQIIQTSTRFSPEIFREKIQRACES